MPQDDSAKADSVQDNSPKDDATHETHTRVREQFGRTAAAYVSSSIHAKGDDLSQMLAVAEAFHGGRVAGKTVLDVATGGGHTALAFARAGAQVTATDLTPEMLKVAEAFISEQEVQGVAFTLASAEALPFAGAAFDIVTCRIAAHHFAAPERFVAETSRVLKPGGLLLLVDNIAPQEPELARIMNTIERRRDPSHVEAYSVAQWVAWFAAAGLDTHYLSRWSRDKNFADWVVQAAMAEGASAELEQDILALKGAQRVYFRVREGADGLESLAHEAMLLVGQKL